MNAIDAAYQVLLDAGEPLHSNEIAQRVIARSLWHTQGKTPGATIDARIAVDIKTHGPASRFRRVGRSTFIVNGDVQSSSTSRLLHQHLRQRAYQS